MSHASKPTRRSGHGTLSFGLISIPVDFYTAADSKATGKVTRQLRSMKTGNAIKYRNVDAVTGDEVLRGEQYKVVVLDDDTEVDLSDEEIMAVISPVKGHAEIIGFVPAEVALGMYPVEHFQVRPHADSQTKAIDPGVAKAWALLSMAMEVKEAAAVVRLAMRDTIGFYTLFPNGRMARVLAEEAVREQRDWPDSPTPSGTEVSLAIQLLEASFSDEPPTMSDDSVEKVLAYCRAKASGTVTAPTIVPVPKASSDLIDQLQKSIAEQVAEKQEARN